MAVDHCIATGMAQITFTPPMQQRLVSHAMGREEGMDMYQRELQDSATPQGFISLSPSTDTGMEETTFTQPTGVK